jgi:hypothetical protein
LEEKKRNSQEAFVPGLDMPFWLCCMGFLQLLGAINGFFKGQSLTFICT